jgi:cytidylate kinase
VSSGVSSNKSFSKPFITISREPGSGGAPVARLVAKKLGFTFVDEQIVEKIAKSTKKRKNVIQAVDEKSRTAIDDIVHSLLNDEYVHDLRYVKELIKVILIYAHEGHCVILGRGANFITPFAYGLHVRITAPYKVRVQRAVDYEGYSEEKAKETIKKVEKDRREFVKQYFGHNIKKSNAYDITINTTYLDIEDTRDVIVKAFCHKFKRSFRYKALLKK